ncbi:threonylcarbamoyl-AMP synthase [Natronorubrum bangense]|uniref:L-threonylcarbamoyladenylate synthase n=1 Tax=Natronorubrum bangense TaxID=61858 RepID=A0A4D6HM74_9EURY|nr:L-threonylcarbamoyladenylate synthase [Natronorubrum bangense]QCC54268.1 threonylcarbamoyl-AMP synthase [Natronorubrum bangense]
MSDLERAAAAINDGKLVVYPTETVYGLGADALDPDAVDAVFDVKDRDRSKPISFAVPSVPSALRYVRATDRERQFMARFLPGPVTVLCRRRESIPDELTAGRDRVGVRVPDHDLALALCERAGTPITATSANVSGQGSVRTPEALDPAIREAASVVLEAGETRGTESTVVDLSTATIHRRGAMADEIEAWLERRC